MLAYLLWHWPFDDVSTGAYEDSLARFHQSLLASAIPGFQQSFVFRNQGVAWTPPGARVFEDWYLLDGSAAMDQLNEAAVSEASKLSHDTTAHRAAGAAGGLYQLKLGTPSLETCRWVSWIAKPRGMGYEEFYRTIQPWTSQPKVSLWRRQMVLGPTPEFAMLSVAAPEPVLNLDVIPVELELVWEKPAG